MDKTKPPAIAIVGPTASGKTSLSIEIAKKFNGEVISADSRQVYRGMDIGTAKVTKDEMQGIPHHLLDICDPQSVYTAADFQQDGKRTLAEITERGHLPVVAGGTFFYLDLLRDTMSVATVSPNETLREAMEKRSTQELLKILTELDPKVAERIDADNPRRLIRAIEIATELGSVPTPQTQASPYDWLVLGIDISLSELEPRILERVHQRIDNGMIEEVERLHQDGVSWERLDAFGLEYRYVSQYLQNKISKEEMIDQICVKTRQFAKRQKTWLKRDLSIHWLPFPVDIDAALSIVASFLTTTR